MLGASALGMYLYQVSSLMDKLKIDFLGVRVRSISLKGVDLAVKIKITNQSKVAIPIKDYNINVYVDDAFITNISSTVPFEIGAFSQKEIEFNAVIDPKSIKSLSSVVLNIKNIKNTVIKVEGTLTVKKFRTPIRIPINTEDTIGAYLEG